MNADMPEMAAYPRRHHDVFERRAWLYAFFREYLFMDHTEIIAGFMQKHACVAKPPVFLEIGCGPGFYASNLARRFPLWRVIGVDRSQELLGRARHRNRAANCSFVFGDAMLLSTLNETVDFALASRLLLVLPDRQRALESVYATLRPGGSLLLAEPRAGWRTTLALAGMGLLRSSSFLSGKASPLYAGEPVSPESLRALLAPLPWAEIRCWSNTRYHFALCRKDQAVS